MCIPFALLRNTTCLERLYNLTGSSNGLLPDGNEPLPEPKLTCHHRCSLAFTRENISILRWRHNDHGGVSNHQPRDCLLNCLFRRRWKKTSKLRVTGLCAGNSPVTGELPAQRASNAENVSIWWRHHELNPWPYIQGFAHSKLLSRISEANEWMMFIDLYIYTFI